MWSFSVILSFVLSFCKPDNWRTRKRTSTKLGTGMQEVTLEKWLTFGGDADLRVDSGFSFSSPLRISDFPTFVSISLFSQSSESTADLNPTWRNEWRRRVYLQFWNGYSTDIQIQTNPKIRIQIQITFVSNFGVGRTSERTSLISKIQNVWSHRFSKRRRL